MTQAIRTSLRAAIFAAIAALGESEARRIIKECLDTLDNDHWGKRS